MAATKTSKKPTLPDVLDLLEKQFGLPPVVEHADDPLLDQLLVGVLIAHVDVAAARAIVRGMSERFLDFNEARVSPLYELEEILAPHVPKENLRAVAWNLRMTLQDVYDGSHGLDLEPLRGAPPEVQRKFLRSLPNIPGGPAAWVFQVALGEKDLAYGSLEEHLLKRLGMQPRSSTKPGIRKALERQIKAPDRARFAWLAGHGAHLHEEEFDPAHPFCQLLEQVNAKELAVREQERKRDEVRRLTEERRRKADEEKQRRADERERKKQEREDAKRQREDEAKRRKADAAASAKAAIAQKKAEAAKQKAAAAKEKAAAATEKAAAMAKQKAEAAKQKVAAAKQKVAEAKKKAAEAKKKAAAKKKTAKKKSVKKPTAKKASVKKTATKKPASAKKTAKKPTAKKASVKRTATKKPASVKKAAKKPTAKKTSTAKKKTSQKRATRTKPRHKR